MPSKKKGHTKETMSKPSSQNITHRNSIRVALIGCVSSGKSTLLNAICVKEYEDMKRKRTTMLPTVYKTTNNTTYPLDAEKIKERNRTLNETFYGCDDKTQLTKENCILQDIMIPEINNFIDVPDGIYLDIYDIPGLNDSTTKDIYFEWIRTNFHEFDVIINVVSIENGCNTSDEKDILTLIGSCLHAKSTETLFLTAINKCDDMELQKGTTYTNPFHY
jgi:GTPase Era involved in 16S rRNA processing